MLALALLLAVISSVAELPAFGWLVSNVVPAALFAIPVIFQPELRRALEQLGRGGRYLRFVRADHNDPAVVALASAGLRLSQRRHGALVVFERDTGLQEYIDTGIKLDSEASQELLLTIFNKETELHDGAVIVREGRLAAAACILPLSTSRVSDRKMGLRHRAALGISEVSDAVAVVISEETGQLSIAHNGRLIRRQEIDRLEGILRALLGVSSPDGETTDHES